MGGPNWYSLITQHPKVTQHRLFDAMRPFETKQLAPQFGLPLRLSRCAIQAAKNCDPSALSEV
jgi:hypothetical protein